MDMENTNAAGWIFQLGVIRRRPRFSERDAENERSDHAYNNHNQEAPPELPRKPKFGIQLFVTK
jgi:hypothetical protein